MKQHKRCRLYDVMVRKDITQEALAKKVKKSQSHISKIVNGGDLYLSTAQEISLAVKEKVDYLWPDYFH